MKTMQVGERKPRPEEYLRASGWETPFDFDQQAQETYWIHPRFNPYRWCPTELALQIQAVIETDGLEVALAIYSGD